MGIARKPRPRKQRSDHIIWFIVTSMALYIPWEDVIVFLTPILLPIISVDNTDRRRNFLQDQEDHENEQGLPDLCQPKGCSAFLSSIPSWWWTYRTRSNTKDARIGRSRPNRLHAGTIWWILKGRLLSLVVLFYFFIMHSIEVKLWLSSATWDLAAPIQRKGIYDFCQKLKNKQESILALRARIVI